MEVCVNIYNLFNFYVDIGKLLCYSIKAVGT
ncbi:hypothetical protein B0P06_004598 [Clostridium saccharoperbutylacetonicum]|uniref:Uncharacterized protein n=1 Tax=Clostridium saccharoperbutylacetonicum N1-4(HMT) TaxID=931276 RepID=M1MGR4_9CLOT|nr:hypothetical protein Cspa_c33530 [Clostridium saccharoperbutylacetonicum N1-4(HMT)]NRT62127.1 hypothetical protein [Clostridium saccharoperbutylacetonicum]NSB25457.1 hypothetical protein [Clostridium saccharoperbutylacetonicum]NSB44827.1 hypothetical protein [Clostridium saccharoperbutylacetonicum]